MTRQDKIEISQNKRTKKWHWHMKSSYNGKLKCSGQAVGFASEQKTREGYLAVAESFNKGVIEIMT
jgi:hypothetical protein